MPRSKKALARAMAARHPASRKREAETAVGGCSMHRRSFRPAHRMGVKRSRAHALWLESRSG
eukprot:2148409-Alexandrium_andersonii.AAC.1